jgi:hypothetical protein
LQATDRFGDPLLRPVDSVQCQMRHNGIEVAIGKWERSFFIGVVQLDAMRQSLHLQSVAS